MSLVVARVFNGTPQLSILSRTRLGLSAEVAAQP